MTTSRSTFLERHTAGWLALTALSSIGCQIEVQSPLGSESEPSSFDGRGPDWVGSPSFSERDPSGPSPPESDLPADESSAPWAEYRDLIAIDPELVQGPLASNEGTGAPLSFRAQMEWLSASTTSPLSFVRSWFEQWTEAGSQPPELPPVPARPGARSLLIDSWLGASSGAGADAGAPADAGYYAPSFVPSWADAPFRLIAIVNRVDLASDPCLGAAGELRYVYAAIDVESGRPLDMTAIVEIPYPTLRPAAEWARMWRDLAELPAGPDYARAMRDLALEVQREADPLRVRVRTNEVALGDSAAPRWDMREFHLEVRGDELALAQVPLESTPRSDADPAALANHVLAHSDEILSGPVPLPPELRAGAAQITDPDFSWAVLGVSDRLRQAFSVETCNGCHGGDTTTLPFQHIAPAATLRSRARLSGFLYDPAAPMDELRRRSAILAELATTACAPTEPTSPYSGGSF